MRSLTKYNIDSNTKISVQAGHDNTGCTSLPYQTSSHTFTTCSQSRMYKLFLASPAVIATIFPTLIKSRKNIKYESNLSNSSAADRQAPFQKITYS
jgi:hypothetical protein